MFSITYPCVYVCRSVIGYDIYIYNCPCVGIRSIYYACLNTNKYYTVQVTNLYTDASDSQDNHTDRDIKAGAFNLFHEQCPLCASYQIVSNPVVYVNACKQPMVLLAQAQGKSNLR